VVLAILVLWVGGCSREAPAPAGDDRPRIVVLSPAVAVILDDMGLAGRVVGRHGYDRVLERSIPVCGEQGSINYEALVRAEPTHVLIEWGSRELPGKLTELADRHGWVLREFRMLTLGDIDRAARELSALFPGEEPGGRVALFHELVAGPVPEPRWDGRVLLLMSASPQITALGPGSAHHELLARAGGVPAIVEGTPYMPMHAEDVLRIAPDAIVLIETGSEGEPVDAGSRLGAIAGLDIPAVKSGRVEVVSDPLALVPGTNLVGIGDAMRAAIDRWADE